LIALPKSSLTTKKTSFVVSYCYWNQDEDDMFAELMNYIVDKKVDVRETITGLIELLIK